AIRCGCWWVVTLTLRISASGIRSSTLPRRTRRWSPPSWTSSARVQTKCFSTRKRITPIPTGPAIRSGFIRSGPAASPAPRTKSRKSDQKAGRIRLKRRIEPDEIRFTAGPVPVRLPAGRSHRPARQTGEVAVDQPAERELVLGEELAEAQAAAGRQGVQVLGTVEVLPGD